MYSDQDIIEALREAGGNKTQAAKLLGANNRAFRRRVQRMIMDGRLSPDFLKGNELDDSLPNSGVVGRHSRYIITSALNNCPLNRAFVKQLRQEAEVLEAQLIVVPVRYKNPSLVQSKEECVWPSELNDCYVSEDVTLSPRLVLAGAARPQATTSRPLSGFEGYGKGKSVVVGHSRIQLRSVPRMQCDKPVYAITTGSCSQPSYSDTKAGVLGHFHHTTAALLVEFDGDKLWWRHIKPGGTAHRFENLDALVLGDIHVGAMDPDNWHAVKGLKAKSVILHDLLDGHAISHHHEGDRFKKYLKHIKGLDDAKSELDKVAAFLSEIDADNVYIAGSNHHDHLDRWLKEGRGANDPVNMHLYYWLCFSRVEAIRRNVSYDSMTALERYLREFAGVGDRVRFLGRNDSLKVHGIELGQHGDVGANGSRGGFNRVRDRLITGHTHSPMIQDGHYCVGTSSLLNLDYTSGHSSWAHVHACIDSAGYVTLFNVEGGRASLDG